MIVRPHLVLAFGRTVVEEESVARPRKRGLARRPLREFGTKHRQHALPIAPEAGIGPVLMSAEPPLLLQCRPARKVLKLFGQWPEHQGLERRLGVAEGLPALSLTRRFQDQALGTEVIGITQECRPAGGVQVFCLSVAVGKGDDSNAQPRSRARISEGESVAAGASDRLTPWRICADVGHAIVGHAIVGHAIATPQAKAHGLLVVLIAAGRRGASSSPRRIFFHLPKYL
mmetsp:Transcript_93930/g.209913  ORF Transcript_93930/g.209913 Transcript_93930/m.209913 type:complete len:229 (+) Transcript_93930:373-1059(+)